MALAPKPVAIANPCDDRDLPDTGGITGFASDAALVALDKAARRFGCSREELVLAFADDASEQAYKDRYGVDPARSPPSPAGSSSGPAMTPVAGSGRRDLVEHRTCTGYGGPTAGFEGARLRPRSGMAAGQSAIARAPHAA